MKSKVIACLVACLACPVFGQDILTVQVYGNGWKVATSAGEHLFVPNDSANRHYKLVQDWIATGGVVQPQPAPSQAVVKAELRERIEAKVGRWLTLQRLKDKLTAASKPALASQVQTLMDNVDADIDALIAQW